MKGRKPLLFSLDFLEGDNEMKVNDLTMALTDLDSTKELVFYLKPPISDPMKEYEALGFEGLGFEINDRIEIYLSK